MTQENTTPGQEATTNLQAAEIRRLRGALERIEKWFGEFPDTGEFWDEEKTRPISYGSQWGSNGERDYMRQIARNALDG